MNTSRLEPSDFSDVNLLFGVLALQLDLINRSRFVEACRAWADRRDVALADLLLERGWLSAEQKAFVDRVIRPWLARTQGDVAGSIRAAADQSTTVSEALDEALAAGTPAGGGEEQGHADEAFDRELRKDLPPFREETLLAGKYRLTKKLGEGSFGSVWLAEEGPPLGGWVALKTLRPAVLRDQPDEADKALAALKQEAALLRKITHPNVIRVYSWEQAGDTPYLVLQYVNGGSLAERVAAGPLPWTEAARYVADVGDGLLAAHAQHILHRDIKPSNILWDRDRNEAVLTDFGVAGRLIGGQTLAGTPRYMAPEALRRRACPASDVFSLAVTLFELLTGKVPFPGATEEERLARIRNGLPDPDPRLTGVPRRLEALLRAALTFDPAQRPELRAFGETLRTTLNRALADDLAPDEKAAGSPGDVSLQISITRENDGPPLVPAAAPAPDERVDRDLKPRKAIPRVALRTGDRVAIEVVADRDGYLTVLNLGPTGNLNLLFPQDRNLVGKVFRRAGTRLAIANVELVAPAGSERIVAVWLRQPGTFPWERLLGQPQEAARPVSRSYRATRDLICLDQAKEQLQPGEFEIAVLELDHQA